MCSGGSGATATTTPAKAAVRPTGSSAGKTARAYVPKEAFRLKQFLPNHAELYIPPLEIDTYRCHPHCKDPKTRCGDSARSTKCHLALLGTYKEATTGSVRKAVLHHNAARRQQRDHSFTPDATGAEIAAYEDWAAASTLICDKYNTARENSLSFLAYRIRVLNQSTTNPEVLAFKEALPARQARARKLQLHREAAADEK